MKIKYCLVVLLLLYHVNINAQRIRQNEKFPDIEFSSVVNYSKPNLSLADFYGKAVILELWSHSCVSCIKSFPRLDALQKKFKDQVQIILINRESKDSTERFLTKKIKGKWPNLPMIMGQAKFVDLFPKKGYPYMVWIDNRGILKYSTGAYNVTEEHISAFIKGVRLEMKEASGKIYHGTLPAGINENTYYSYITGCNDSITVGSGNGIPINNGKSVRLSSDCTSIEKLYKEAYAEKDKYNFNVEGTFILDVLNSYKYVRPKDNNQYDAWRSQNAYSYDLVVPRSKKNDIYKMMQQDLDRFFDLDVKLEKKPVKSLVLVRTSDKDKLHSNGGKSLNKLEIPAFNNHVTDSAFYVQNLPFKNFATTIWIWVERILKVNFVDRTNYTGNIDMKINFSPNELFDLSKLKKALQPYDLDLVEEYLPREVLTIKEKQIAANSLSRSIK